MLATIYIPQSIATIGNEAFSGCTSLAEIYFGGTKSEWESISKGDDWAKNTTSLSIICSDGTIGIYVAAFNANGGNFTANHTTYTAYANNIESGKCATKPTEEPTNEGYKLLGWSEDKDSETADYSFETPVTKDITLYAIWEEDTYNVNSEEDSADGTIKGLKSILAQQAGKINITGNFEVKNALTVTRDTEIDLNDCTIIYDPDDSVKDRLFTIESSNTLTVNSGDSGKIQLGSEEYASTNALGIFSVNGNLVINGGTFESYREQILGTNRGSVVSVEEYGKATINGGTYYGKTEAALYIIDGTTTINGGTFKSDFYSEDERTLHFYTVVNEGGTLTIGGETKIEGIQGAIYIYGIGETIINNVTATANSVTAEDKTIGYYAINTNPRVNSKDATSVFIKLTINGGTFTAKNKPAININATVTDSKVNITSGSFSGKDCDVEYTSGSKDYISISGGSFKTGWASDGTTSSIDILSGLLETGYYLAADTTTGMWKVVK